MPEGLIKHIKNRHKPGLRIGMHLGDVVRINDDLEIEFIGFQGAQYIRLLFRGEPSRWKINRVPHEATT